MSASFLTIDLGNSRCKLRQWGLEPGAPARLERADDWEPDAGLPGRLAARLAESRGWAGATLASVAAAGLETELARVLQAALGARFRAAPDPGLEIACRVPAEVGRDRLFAARGAFELVRGACLVLDAGTALTVDAVRPGEGGRGRFLGGAIAPGPRLLARALAQGTARLFEVAPVPPVRALGRDTREALEAGVAVGFAGAARELVARIAAEAGLADAPLLLTGGARDFLDEPGLFGARPRRSEPELVHLGLLAAALPGSAWS